MNVKEYLKRKTEQKKTDEDKNHRSKCFVCFRPRAACLCHHIKPFNTKTKFVILIHPMEAKKQRLGTGRMSLAFLKNSQKIMGVDFTDDETVNQIIDDSCNLCVVLYPGKSAFNISTTPIEEFHFQKDKKLVVFIIDGTWPCARKMMMKSTRVRSLPRICFTPTKQSEFVIKHQPDTFCLSTIESIHLLLSEMDRVKMETLDKAHDQMIEAFKSLNDFQISCASNPTLPSYRKKSGYKKPSERNFSKKWEKRNLITE